MFWLVDGSVTANPLTILSGCIGHAAHVHEYDRMMLFRGEQNCDLGTLPAWMLSNLLEKAGSISGCFIGLQHRSCRPKINKRNRDLSVLYGSTMRDKPCTVLLQERLPCENQTNVGKFSCRTQTHQTLQIPQTHLSLLVYKHFPPFITTEASNLIKVESVNTLIRKIVTHRCLHFQKVLIPFNVLWSSLEDFYQ